MARLHIKRQNALEELIVEKKELEKELDSSKTTILELEKQIKELEKELEDKKSKKVAKKSKKVAKKSSDEEE